MAKKDVLVYDDAGRPAVRMLSDAPYRSVLVPAVGVALRELDEYANQDDFCAVMADAVRTDGTCRVRVVRLVGYDPIAARRPGGKLTSPPGARAIFGTLLLDDTGLTVAKDTADVGRGLYLGSPVSVRTAEQKDVFARAQRWADKNG